MAQDTTLSKAKLPLALAAYQAKDGYKEHSLNWSLPERHTDFIFAVIAEEWGLIGISILLGLYLFVIGRGLILASKAQTAFGRMMAGSIVLSFCLCFCQYRHGKWYPTCCWCPSADDKLWRDFNGHTYGRFWYSDVYTHSQKSVFEGNINAK